MNMKMWLPVMAMMGMSMQSSRAEVMPDSLNSGINVRNLDKNVRPGADFYEFACGVSGYMLGVNPFDQPGVESYKRNMFALLGKPGYEALLKEITEKAAARSKEAAK